MKKVWVNMRLKHHQQIVDMLYEEWDLGKTKSQARGKTCAWVYWFEILSEVEQLVIEKRNGNIVGICGYSKWDSKKHLVRKHFYKVLAYLLTYSPLIKDSKSLVQYSKDYDYLPKELEGYFNGEIAIIIVEKRHRKQKLGKKILTEAFKLAKNDGLKNLQILTDQSCNYKFYERMGCKKIYETLISNGEPDKRGDAPVEMGYIYEKQLVGAAK